MLKVNSIRSLVATLALVPAAAIAQAPPSVDPFTKAYAENCAACHGADLEGSAQGVPLAGVNLRHGDSVEQIAKSIAEGFPQQDRMPAFGATMDEATIRRLAIFVSEKRHELAYTDFKVSAPPQIPEGPIRSEKQTFRVETFASGLDPLPYSMAALPDGSFLVTEKTRGLRMISADGKVSALLRNTPEAYHDGFEVPGILLVMGLGYLLDVAPHPDYAKNGWVYLSYSDRCTDCNELAKKSKRPVTMVTLVRGRIRNGEWVDQESIWKADIAHYTNTVDIAAGGRIAFDNKGHVFLTIGIKGRSESDGIQDLSLPYGKILRVNDDGSVPKDNPFVGKSGAIPAIYTYGHRTPEGLAFNRNTGKLWGTEMGQRGGDEVNLLASGKNYGWPLVSKGLKYDGAPVDFGKELGIAFDLKDIEQPVVDLTPSPAVSSFAFYEGKAFPKWKGNMLVGTLKATELYRMEMRGDRVVHTETLLKGLGRIRDVTVGNDGAVYLLIEHKTGGRVLRLVPAK